jgi:hypothetical protein
VSKKYSDVLKAGLYAKMDLFADISFVETLYKNKALQTFIDAFHDMSHLAMENEEKFIFEHAVHHAGLTKKTWGTKKITRPDTCASVKEILRP